MFCARSRPGRGAPVGRWYEPSERRPQFFLYCDEYIHARNSVKLSAPSNHSNLQFRPARHLTPVSVGLYIECMNACERNPQTVFEMAKAGNSLTAIGLAVGTKRQIVHAFLKKNLPGWQLNRDTSGARNKRWKGGRRIDKDGYVLIHLPTHPNCDSHGLVREHRLVMEKILGRYLLPSEVVHHRSKNKQDNAPENLQLFSENAEHLKHELTGHCPNWTEDGKQRISAGVARAVTVRRERIQQASKQNDLRLP